MFCPSCGKKNENDANKCNYCETSLEVKIIKAASQSSASENPYQTNLSIPSNSLLNSNILPPSAYETTKMPAVKAQELIDKEAEKKASQLAKPTPNVSSSKDNTATNWQLNLSLQWILFLLASLLSLLFIGQMPKLNFISYQENFIDRHLFSQITGFTALLIIFLQILLTIRKRLNLFSKLSFNFLRGLHIIGGISLIIVVLIHTGGYWKWNFNGALLLMFLTTVLQASLGNTLETRLTKRMILRRLASKYSKKRTGPIEEERVAKAVLHYLEKTSQNEEMSRQKAKEQAKQLWRDLFYRITDIQLTWEKMKLDRELANKRNGPEEGALTTQLSKLAASRFWAEVSRNKRPTAVQLMKILWTGLHIIFVSSFLVLLFFHILSIYYF